MATLPAGLEPVVTRAMTADGVERLDAARVLAASDPWRRASPAERAIAAWAMVTFDGDGGGYLRAPPGLEHRPAGGARLPRSAIGAVG